MSDNNQPNSNHNEDEIDLIALARTLWEGRKIIIKTIIVFIFFGLFIALFSQKEYTATTTMVPQINNPSSKLGGLSSLASLAGFNLDISGGASEISPMLYPQIVSSTAFQLEIMNAKYSFDELDKEVTLFDYYMNYYKPGLFDVLKKYTFGLPGVIINWIKAEPENVDIEDNSNNDIIRITKGQYKICKILNEKLNLNVNDKDGYLTLEARFHEAGLSALIAEKALKQLQGSITKLKVEKAGAQLEFIQGRYNEAKEEFNKVQAQLAEFRDANKNITSAIAQTEQEKIENEYQLAFDVYSELAKQLEQARIKVKEDTPVFSVIEEVVVPIEKSKPKRAMILVIWIFLGGIVGVGVVFGKNLIPGLKKGWEEQDD